MSAFAYDLRDRPVQEVLKLTSRRLGRALRNPAHRRRVDEGQAPVREANLTGGELSRGFEHRSALTVLDPIVGEQLGVGRHPERLRGIHGAEPLVTVDGHGADLMPTAFSGNGG